MNFLIRLLTPLLNWTSRSWRRDYLSVGKWKRAGCPAPPPHIIKQRMLREYGRKYGLRTMVETGTADGWMVKAMLYDFDHIYTIELSDALYEKACRTFRRWKHVHLVHGDSGVEIENVVQKLGGPTLFWLDGHYSAGVTALGDKPSPIMEELGHVFRSPISGHVILIDDAREFGSDPEYPTLDEVKAFIHKTAPEREVTVKYDSIIITPPAPSAPA